MDQHGHRLRDDWAPLLAALGVGLAALALGRSPAGAGFHAGGPRAAHEPTPMDRAAPPRTDPAGREAGPPAQHWTTDPWRHNCALSSNRVRATGGQRAQLLIDGVTRGYATASGFAETPWNVKPTQPFVLTFPLGVQLNTVRILLWDQDDRFYRYKLEASAAMARDEWVTLADRSGEPWRCRSWQVIPFPTQWVCRLRLTGAYNSANAGFHVVEVEAYNVPGGLTEPWVEPEF